MLCENHVFREKLLALKAFEARSSAKGLRKDDEAGPSTEGHKDDTEPPAPAKKKSKKKKKKKKVGASIADSNPTTAGEKANGEPQTPTEEAKDAAQTVEDHTCPEDQEDEILHEAHPPQSTETEILDKNPAETEIHEGSSSPQNPIEGSKSQIEQLEVTKSANPAEAIISAKCQGGDGEQHPQDPASNSPKAVKKKAKKQPPRKQAPQVSYQKWEKANELKKKHPLGEKSKDPVVASASSAKGQGDNTEPPIEGSVVEEAQSEKGREEDSILTQEDSTSLPEILPAIDQQETSMPHEVDPEVSGAPELAEDQRETSQHQAEGPAMADSLSAEGQADHHHEPEKQGPVVTELPLAHTPPLAPQPKDTDKPKKKKKPVVIARTPVARWNQPDGSGCAPWTALYPIVTGPYMCSCVADAAFAPQQPAVGHFALDEDPYGPPQPWQPSMMGYHPGGPSFRPQASTFEPGVPFHQL